MSACSILIYFKQICVYLFFVPLFLHRIGNLLAYDAALFLASVYKSTAHIADPSTGEYKYSGLRIDSATAKDFLFNAFFNPFFFKFHFWSYLLFCRFFACVCKAQLRVCVKILNLNL